MLGLTEGWWFPVNARKSHYMRERKGRTQSLCLQWTAWLRDPTELDLQADDDVRGPGDCATCRRKLDEEKLLL